MVKRKSEILEEFNDKIADLRERGLDIQELIERAKTEADVGLHDILDKWKIANDKILQQYPEGHRLSQEQLEEVARQSIEVVSVQSDEVKIRPRVNKRSTTRVHGD